MATIRPTSPTVLAVLTYDADAAYDAPNPYDSQPGTLTPRPSTGATIRPV